MYISIDWQKKLGPFFYKSRLINKKKYVVGFFIGLVPYCFKAERERDFVEAKGSYVKERRFEDFLSSIFLFFAICIRASSPAR